MKKRLLLLAFLAATSHVWAQQPGASVYPQRLRDTAAAYFPASDGRSDVTAALQQAINDLKTQRNFGILFLPEGKYRISNTIYVPQAIRLIGYGSKRPEIILAENAPGFQVADSTDKGRAKYMLWFTGGEITQPGKPVQDAGAGTFYSALSNINLRIEDGNPAAIALRTHYAQHSFIAHADLYIGNGKAGMFDVGNEMEDVRFFGGEYGILTTKPSPGWQFMMTDTWFEGQRKAAIRSREAGLTIVRLHAKQVPVVIDVMPEFHEELFMEDCQFEQVSGPAINISRENNASNQVSLRHIDCRDVPVLAHFRESNTDVKGAGKLYVVKNFLHGLQMDSLRAAPETKTLLEMAPLAAFPAMVKKDIPALPDIKTWVNLKDLGAAGDGITDDTKAIQAAINKYPNIYVPQGWYRVSETIHLQSNTALIGLTPIGTQFLLANNTEAFGSFGGPKPLLETAPGGHNMVTGIGLNTGADNTRAVACKWTAGADSYLNDVKFVGGHGGMDRFTPDRKPETEAEKAERRRRWNMTDPSWDTQYWSLWITDGGGGTFKDIWSANTYAAAGAYVSNTATPGRIYAMSVEHHVRNEVRFSHVRNWRVYALQLEEESKESSECQPLELDQCSDMVFGNLYMFRVIRVIRPYPYSIRNWGSQHIELLNVHNYSQIKYTTTAALYDVNSDYTLRPWEFNRLVLGAATQTAATGKLATGFEFAEGACTDSKGNVYWCESRMRRIYKWDAAARTNTLLADYPWEPLSLACDKQDHLLVVFKYVPKPGYRKDGEAEVFVNPPDAAGTSFSGWGNSGFATWAYSIDPANPDESIQKLPTVKMGSLQPYQALYPAHRWRDGHDFSEVILDRPDSCFLAPDGATIIPIVYDLARAANLVAAYPGKPVYVADEYEKRTVQLQTGTQGYVAAPKLFAEKGEFCTAVDARGNVYIGDGEVYVYDAGGKLLRMLHVPERPTALALGGAGSQILYMTGHNAVYAIPL